MALGAVAIALSSANEREHSSWQDAAQREGERYGVESEYVRAGMEGRAHQEASMRRTLVDWILVIGTTALFVALALLARFPQIHAHQGWAAALTVVMLFMAAWCGIFLWRTTQFR